MAFQGTFGIEVTDEGLMTFGSALPFGSAASQGQPILVSAMPLGITYQQLKHPVLLDDGSATYDNTAHRMTQVVSSCNFNGKAFVAAKFTDGNTYLYYDGALVDASRNGIVLTGKTSLASLGTDLARQVNALTSWRGVANKDSLGATSNGQDQVYSAQGVYFATPVATNDSVSGLQGASNVPPNDGAGTPGVSAMAEFQVSNNGTAGTSTFQVLAPKNSDGTGSVDLCGGVVTAGANATATATLIANAINTNTVFTGYYALRNGVSIGVFAPVSWGSSINTFNLTVTAVGGTAATTASSTTLTMTVAANPASANFTFHNSKFTPSAPVISATGGTTPYTTYAWTQVNQDGTPYSGPFPVTITPSNGATLGGLRQSGTVFGWTATLYFKGAITDSNPTTVSVIVAVSASP